MDFILCAYWIFLQLTYSHISGPVKMGNPASRCHFKTDELL